MKFKIDQNRNRRFRKTLIRTMRSCLRDAYFKTSRLMRPTSNLEKNEELVALCVIYTPDPDADILELRRVLDAPLEF